MRLLFVGDDWLGSNARSLREAFERRPELEVRNIETDARAPMPRSLAGRAALRLAYPLKRALLERRVRRAVAEFRPDATVFYKGAQFSAPFLRRLAGRTTLVNCFPDYSPHAYGRQMQAAMGAYDLVVSTKPYHPANWRSTYGYDNPCVFVPHGYDPGLHLRESPPEAPDYDVVLVAAGRPEYYELVRGLAEQLADTPLRVGIGGNAWGPLAASLPAGWDILGPKFGPEYIDLLRRGSIVIAPVQRHVRIRGTVQPGDEDTARTYEIAAAYCFFIHQRTDFAAELYDEHAEVPLFGSAAELAKQIRFYLQHDDLRHRMAAAAHARAVPGFALDARAHEIVGHLTQLLARRRSLRS